MTNCCYECALERKKEKQVALFSASSDFLNHIQKMDDSASLKNNSRYNSLPSLPVLKKDISTSVSSFATASSHGTLGRLQNIATTGSVKTLNGTLQECPKAEFPLQNGAEKDLQEANKRKIKNLQVLCAAALLQSAKSVSLPDVTANKSLHDQHMRPSFKENGSIQNVAISDQESIEVSSPVSDILHVCNDGERTVSESNYTEETVLGINGFCSAEVDDYVSCSSSWGSMISRRSIEKTEAEKEEEEEEIDAQLPPYFQELLKGMTIVGDKLNVQHSSTVFPEPYWLDQEKFRRGQEVALRYHFGLVFSEVLSLFMLFSFPDGLGPLIFTGKSDTPFKAFRRYLSTVLRVKSWYEHNPWKPDSKAAYNLSAVRKVHESVRNQLQETSTLELARRYSVATSSPLGCPCAPVWSPLIDKLQDDFQSACPYPRPGQRPYMDPRKKREFISQWDMVGTQFGFVSLFVMFPKHFGAHRVTDDELDCFLHTWRAIGYMLGIEDSYNFCNGSLETIRQRCKDYLDLFVKPNFRDVCNDWEHMSRCVMEGVSYYVPKVSFEVSLLYLCNMLNINAPRLRASLTFRQKYNYYSISFVYHYLCRIPGMLRLLNWLLEIAIKRAQNFSLERLTRLERKIYPYQTT